MTKFVNYTTSAPTFARISAFETCYNIHAYNVCTRCYKVNNLQSMQNNAVIRYSCSNSVNRYNEILIKDNIG